MSVSNTADYEKVKTLLAAALDIAPEKRAAFFAQTSAESDVIAEAQSLLEACVEAGDFLDDVSAAETIKNSFNRTDRFVGRTIDKYRVVREIGRGGMGVVMLAEREDFHQQVAVKLIKRGMDSDAILEHFTREREILAALNHPYIARLTDGGTTADDLPFFVMEYVEGAAVDDYCQINNLSEKETLELFRKICEAVSFAHQKLVIHRDLKPSNILVCADGTPKLLDFGIAKLLNTTDARETQTNMRVLTPAYASPEQIAGERVDTTSDVYSLGVILYEMLTGGKPVAAKSSSQSDKKTDDNLTIEPKLLKGDLGNILRKALRKEPERRYASVEQFSEDIRRHLEGLPVTARRDTAAYRAAKFIKRHKVGTLSALAILVILLGGIAATGWEAHRARLAQERSERRFEDVRQLSNTMLFELNDEIEKGPTAARAMIVKKATEYLDKLNSESEGDVSLKLELITAYVKVGDLQGRPFAPNLGDLNGALESYQKADDLVEPLARSEPSNPVFIRKFADVRQRVGEIHNVQQNRSAALDDFTQLMNLREKVLALDAQNPDYRREQADAEMRMGDVLQSRSYESENVDFPAVIGRYQKALAVLEDLANSQPTYCSKDRFTAASIEQRIGLALNRLARRDNIIENSRQANNHYAHVLSVIERFAAEEPGNLNYQRILNGVRGSIAETQADLGDYGAALENYRQIEITTEAAATRDKANIETRINLSSFYITYAEALEKSGDSRRAIEKLRRGIKVAESVLPDAGTRIEDVHGTLLTGYLNLALETEKLKDFQSSSNSYSRALEYCEKLLSTDADNQKLLQQKSLILSHLKGV